MNDDVIVEGVIVHPVNGMQLCEGFICMDASRHYVGSLTGMTSLSGDSVEDVLSLLERKAKAYYGDDVVVEIIRHLSAT